jgi:mono/diheme cytochrome c family protein
MASPHPDPLRAIDRVLAPVTWAVAIFAVLVLLVGPQLIGADKPTPKPAAAAEKSGAPPAGDAVFASAGCGGCHTLKAAGASGATGPNLDSLKPDAGTVTAVVKSGSGAMPAFDGRLSGAEIQAVAEYVSQNAGR